MRSSRPPKQCLWLGTSQYRNGCRNAATNSNRFADSCVERYSVWADNANANAFSYSNSNGNSDRYTYDDSFSITFAYTDGHPYSYGYAKGDTEASADAASPAVSA